MFTYAFPNDSSSITRWYIFSDQLIRFLQAGDSCFNKLGTCWLTWKNCVWGLREILGFIFDNNFRFFLAALCGKLENMANESNGVCKSMFTLNCQLWSGQKLHRIILFFIGPVTSNFHCPKIKNAFMSIIFVTRGNVDDPQKLWVSTSGPPNYYKIPKKS